MKPIISMVIGDPAGIGSELIAKLLNDKANLEKANILLISDESEFLKGIELAGQKTFDYISVDSFDSHLFDQYPVVLLVRNSSEIKNIGFGKATSEGGKYSLDTMQEAISMTSSGKCGAFCFGPLNKESMHKAGMGSSDELGWFAKQLKFDGVFGEFNIMDDLWTARVTSHVALKDVPSLITEEKIIEAAQLITHGLKNSGIANPRIGVCGLNPHNGDNGSFGNEEITTITPAVQKAKDIGLNVEGPFPADTIFLKVKDKPRQYDGIVTMYHDQGQIAMKLMGFSQGVTVHGGFPIPIATPAHGTAFDIAGKGVANIGAMQAAFNISVKMAENRAN